MSRPAPRPPVAGGTADHLPRLLALVPYLLARPGVRFAEVAEVFGVTEDRLRKDLNLLWVCGLPGHGPGDLIDVEFEGDTITLFEPAGVTRSPSNSTSMRSPGPCPGSPQTQSRSRSLRRRSSVIPKSAATSSSRAPGRASR